MGQPRATVFAPIPHQPERKRGTRNGGHGRDIMQPVSSPGYTLARSILLNPSNLSPHSLASPGPITFMGRSASRQEADLASGYGSAPDEGSLDGNDEDDMPQPRSGLSYPGSAPNMLHLSATTEDAHPQRLRATPQTPAPLHGPTDANLRPH